MEEQTLSIIEVISTDIDGGAGIHRLLQRMLGIIKTQWYTDGDNSGSPYGLAFNNYGIS